MEFLNPARVVLDRPHARMLKAATWTLRKHEHGVPDEHLSKELAKPGHLDPLGRVNFKIHCAHVLQGCRVCEHWIPFLSRVPWQDY